MVIFKKREKICEYKNKLAQKYLKSLIKISFAILLDLDISSQVHPYGCSKHVFTFTTKGDVEIYTDPLKEMLNHPDVKNRRVVAFSLIGAYRQGKSFLLNYCLRYLY